MFRIERVILNFPQVVILKNTNTHKYINERVHILRKHAALCNFMFANFSKGYSYCPYSTQISNPTNNQISINIRNRGKFRRFSAIVFYLQLHKL